MKRLAAHALVAMCATTSSYPGIVVDVLAVGGPSPCDSGLPPDLAQLGSMMTQTGGGQP